MSFRKTFNFSQGSVLTCSEIAALTGLHCTSSGKPYVFRSFLRARAIHTLAPQEAPASPLGSSDLRLLYRRCGTEDTAWPELGGLCSLGTEAWPALPLPSITLVPAEQQSQPKGALRMVPIMTHYSSLGTSWLSREWLELRPDSHCY